MERKNHYPAFFLLLFLISCKHNPHQEKGNRIGTVTITAENVSAPGHSRTDTSVIQLPGRVLLDTLLENITNQQNVKILIDLEPVESETGHITTYRGGGYSFRIKVNGSAMSFPDDPDAENTIFFDGKKKMAFRDYKVTCYDDSSYRCEDFGFNAYNYLVDPRIIEVCGKEFLYTGIGFACNGMGCGQRLTMIYDLKEKKPTFVGNFRLPFDQFLLSDFDHDNNPDLLVTARTSLLDIRGTGIPGYYLKLLVYTYDKGLFRLNKDHYIDLYAVGEDDAVCYTGKNSWFNAEK